MALAIGPTIGFGAGCGGYSRRYEPPPHDAQAGPQIAIGQETTKARSMPGVRPSIVRPFHRASSRF